MAQIKRRTGAVTTTSPESPKQQLRSILLILFLGLIWGSSFFLIKKGLVAFSAPQVGAFRIFIAFVSLLPMYLGIKLSGIKRDHWIGLTVVALFGSGIPPFLFSWAQTHIASYVAGVLNALTPLATMLFGYVLYKTVFQRSQIIGVLIGFVGAALIILFNADLGFDQDFEYSLLVVAAAACYGIGANTLKAKVSDLSPFTVTTLAFSIIGPFAGLYLWYSGAFTQIATEPAAQQAILYLVALGVIGTAFALVVFNYLIQSVSALYASTVTYIIPMVALMWGMLDGETIGLAHVAGLILILAGIKLTGK